MLLLTRSAGGREVVGVFGSSKGEASILVPPGGIINFVPVELFLHDSYFLFYAGDMTETNVNNNK